MANTEEGKAVTRYNAVTHGMRSAALVIPGVESESEFAQFCGAMIVSLNPVGALEMALAARATELFWRIQRVGRAEQAMITARQEAPDEREGRERSEGGHSTYDRSARAESRAELARLRYLPSDAENDRIMRYEAHLSRQLYQALHELEACQRRREGELTQLARLDISAELAKLSSFKD